MPSTRVDIHQLFDWSLTVFQKRRREASEIHRLDCNSHLTPEMTSGICDCGEPGRQRLQLDAMRNAAAHLNREAAQAPSAGSRAAAEHALRVLLWAFNAEPDYPEK